MERTTWGQPTLKRFASWAINESLLLKATVWLQCSLPCLDWSLVATHWGDFRIHQRTAANSLENYDLLPFPLFRLLDTQQSVPYYSSMKSHMLSYFSSGLVNSPLTWLFTFYSTLSSHFILLFGSDYSTWWGTSIITGPSVAPCCSESRVQSP